MKSIRITILLAMVILVSSYQYTLPGDATWPNSTKFQEIRAAVTGKVIFRGDSDYKPYTWNTRTNTPKPAVIVKPSSKDDIIAAMKFANKYNLRLSVGSTGYHQDVRNIFDNAVHIDMSTMNFKSIDTTNKTITVGTGNNWRMIQDYVASQTGQTLVAVGGADQGVGPYGWTTGGGHGHLTRLYGLGVDTVVSMDIIIANYTIVTASNDVNKELFRALRGSGGPNYGIAASMTMKLFDNPGKVSTFYGFYPLNSTTSDMFANWTSNAPNQVGAYYLPSYVFDVPFASIFAFCFGNSTFCSPYLTPLQTNCVVSNLTNCNVELDKYSNFYNFFTTTAGNDVGQKKIYLASSVLTAQTAQSALRDVGTFIVNNKYSGCSVNAVLGGVSTTLDQTKEDTSVSPEMRKAIMAISCYYYMPDLSTKAEIDAKIKLIDDLAEGTLKKASPFVYWNEPQHNFQSEDWQTRYWGGMDNYNRLLKVKQNVDPNGFFTCYHCINYSKATQYDPASCPDVTCTCSNSGGVCASTPTVSASTLILSYFSLAILLVILL